eukprot:PLAT11964.1.p2 GENE.PLAT11964.1~~PLAT11964.1.p2  ORF type:complete len:119 (+),score=39.69 PLAT11964.1:87-443(+)
MAGLSIAPTLDELASKESVVGVLIADGNGLCVGTRGVADSSAAGYLASLLSRSESLAPPDSDTPAVVTIETKGHRIVVSRAGALTVATYEEVSAKDVAEVVAREVEPAVAGDAPAGLG